MESLLLQCVVSLVLYPKYYKHSNEYCTFLGSLGCQGNTENQCDFASKYPTFVGVFSYFLWSMQVKNIKG